MGVIRLGVLGVLVLGTVGFAGDRQESLGEKVVAEARRVLGEVKETKYQHQTEIDEGAGRFYVDCSGFVGFVLKRVAPEQLKGIQIPKGRKRALAEDFYDAIAGANGERGWVEVKRIAEARAGDVMTWKHEHQAGENTGHVLIVAEPAVVEKEGLVRVVVMDSTSLPHASDTRGEGETGVGRGTMWVVVDGEGKGIGFKRKSVKGPVHEEPVAVGRLVEMGDAGRAK